MSLSRSRNKFVQYAKPSTPPRQGTAELFFDINNYGYPTVYYPDGTTHPLVANIMIDGETLVIGTAINELYTNYCEDTRQGNGFIPGSYESTSSISFSSNTFTITGDRAWYQNGCKYEKILADTLSISLTANTLTYIYYNNGTLTSTTDINNIDGVLVATLYSDGTTTILSDERHTTSFDIIKDKKNNDIRAKYINGFDISVSGNTFSGNITIGSGTILCDDIVKTFSSGSSFRPIGQNGNLFAMDASPRSIPAHLDSNTYVCYYDSSDGWTTLSTGLTSYTIMATNIDGNAFLTVNDNLEESLMDVLNNSNIILPKICRYAVPLYRIICDKVGNIAAVIDLRYITREDNSKVIKSNLTSQVYCDHVRNDTAARYDIINYMGATGDFTTSLAITADGSAATGLYVSGEVDYLGSMANITNNGSGTALIVSNTDGGKALEVSGNSDINGKVVYGIETISAGATITPTGNKRVIKVTSDSSSQNNVLTMPTGTAGQVITIINCDEDPINGDVYIPSGECQTYIYVDSTVGWMSIGYGQMVSTVTGS